VTDTMARTAGGPLVPGTEAPDFTLHSTPDQTVALRDFRGRPVILAFYPADWSPVCGDQMVLYNEILPEFQRYGAELLGLSVDGVGAVARRYGVYRDGDGTTERALFVIDGGGIVRWSYLSPIGVNPGADGILRALETLAPERA